MKQLTGLDASFLYMETPTTFGHVNGLGIYDRPSDDFDPFEEVRSRFHAFVGHMPPMRRRLVEVPFALDHPYWIEDPHFDIDYHVRHIGLAPPGAADQLAEQVSRIVGRPMDRSHPLWEAYVIEGLADGRWALLTKTHHSTIDGASGVMFLEMLTSADPDPTPKYQKIDWEGEEIPSDVELLAKTVGHLVTNPVKGMRLQLRLMQDLADAAGIDGISSAASAARDAVRSLTNRESDASNEHERRVNVPLTPAPPTPWNKAITPHRRFAMRAASLANLKALKTATGGTLNDVVMAICTGALREYLIKHDALPDAPLRAMVPVSIRTGEETDPWTNRVSGIVADLPTNEPDPLERVRLCREAMMVAKETFDLLPAEAMTELTQFASPAIAASATRLASRLRLSDRVNGPINVVISNVPGPRQPLYFAGAKLDAYIPVSIVTEGVGLNITVHSYGDRMDFGLISDRELIPDLWDLVDMHMNELERLFEASGAEWVTPMIPPAMRRGDAHTAAIPRREPGTFGSADPKSAEVAAKRLAVDTASSATKNSTAEKKPAKKTPTKKSASKKRKKAVAKKKAPVAKKVSD